MSRSIVKEAMQLALVTSVIHSGLRTIGKNK